MFPSHDQGEDIDFARDSLSSTRLKTFEINESLRIQEVNFYIDVNQTIISESGGKVHLAINCFDFFGLILDLRQLDLDHRTFADDLSLFLPKISLEATRTGVNKNEIVLELFNESFISMSFDVFYKVTSECGSLDLMRFKSSGRFKVGPKERRRIRYTGLDRDWETSNDIEINDS